MSLSLNQSLSSAGGNKLLPDIDSNLKSWCTTPTTDGKTLSNIQGSSVNLKNVNLLSFDGNGDEVDFGQALAFEVTDSWTTEFTIEFDSTPSSFQWIVGKEGSSKGWAIRNGNSSNREKLNFMILGTNSGGSLTTDAWQTDANVLDGTLTTWKVIYNGSSASFYKNGVAVASSQTVNGDVVNMSTTANATLGQRDGSSGDISADVSNLKVYNDTTTYLHAPLAEGSGNKAYDVSGNGNHGTITNASWATKNSIASWNHQYGFDTDKFKGYSGYWDLANSASGTWTIGESSLSLTGNSGSSSRIRQTVDMDIGASLVVSGTVVQTGGSQGGEDLAISSSSVGWAQGSVFLGGSAGTYTFSTSLTAIASSCDVQFIGLNGVTLTISDIKFTVVKKIPALNTKTKQVATFDGAADQINTGYNPSGDLIIDARIKADSVTGQKIIHQCNENAGYFFRISNGEWQLYVGNGYVFSTSTGIDPAVDTLYDTRVEYTASSNAWVVKVKVATDSTYTTVGSGTRTPAFSSANFILGQKGSSMFFDGEDHSFKITDGGATKVEYDFQSDIGTSTVQDLSTNDNDGTVTTGSGGTATFWGTRVADTAGSLVSADYNVGNTTISNPAGFVHNGSECGFETGLQELTSTEIFAIDNNDSASQQLFIRKDNGNITQFFEYESNLTGTDLTRTRAYVG